MYVLTRTHLQRGGAPTRCARVCSLQQLPCKTRLDLSLFHFDFSLPKLSYSTPIPTSKWMYVPKVPNLIPIRLPRRTQALFHSHYSPLKRKTDPSYSISTRHATQKYPCDATPIPSISWSVQASTAPFPRRALLSPSSSFSSALQRVASP